ncbi:MAG: hypothetical protein ACYSUI_07765 [Planctomycetota bacterium]|jgi:hypothetical protein
MSWLRTIALFLRALLRDRAELAAENLALREQLAVLERQSKRPRLRKRDRIFWAWLSRLWGGWRSALVIVHVPWPGRCGSWRHRNAQMAGVRDHGRRRQAMS